MPDLDGSRGCGGLYEVGTIRDTAALRSERFVTELHGLARVATAHARIGDVADLRHDITALKRSAQLAPSAP